MRVGLPFLAVFSLLLCSSVVQGFDYFGYIDRKCISECVDRVLKIEELCASVFCGWTPLLKETHSKELLDTVESVAGGHKARKTFLLEAVEDFTRREFDNKIDDLPRLAR